VLFNHAASTPIFLENSTYQNNPVLVFFVVTSFISSFSSSFEDIHNI